MKKLLEILLSEKGKAILRHGLTFIGGTLVTLGVIDESLLESISGAATTIFGLILSILHKRTLEKV